MQDTCDTLLPHLGGNYGRVTKRSEAVTWAIAGPTGTLPLARESGSPLSQLMCMQPDACRHGWGTPR
jgi:hypothetical protein